MRNFIMINYWVKIIFLITNAPGIFSMEGGIAAVSGEFNYFVSIWNNYEHWCSGVIIDKEHVLTTGSCLQDIPLSHLRVMAGAIHLEDPNIQILEVHSVWRHPRSAHVVDFVEPNKMYWTDDIAVIRLSRELVWGPNAGRVVAIGSDDHWSISEECTMPGWHNTMSNGQRRMSLRWTHGIVMTEGECLPSETNLLSNEKSFCAPVVMERDRGSPLICRDRMVGFLVRGGEALDSCVVLTITPYYDFITTVINDGKTDIDLDEFRYVVSIWFMDALICGGVIIDSLHIVTAGHCIPRYSKHHLHVVAGKFAVEHTDHMNEWLQIDSIEKHSGNKKNINPDGRLRFNYRNDIAILKLKEPLIWSPTIGPGILHSSETAPSLFCHILRWQYTKIEDTTTSIKLMWSSAVIPHATNIDVSSLQKNQIVVAGGNLLSASNPEDCGNPVVCNGVIIGIVVDTFLDNTDWSFVPTVVLDISRYVNFIKSAL